MSILGYGLGGTSVALVGRECGGSYAQAADGVADLSGKNDYGFDEADYRNPACTSGNVGITVGDTAEIGAGMFGSFAECALASLVLAASPPGLRKSWCGQFSPTGIVVGLLALMA